MSDTNTNNEWQERECGAFWKQKGKNQNYLSGHIEVDNDLGEKSKVKLVVFSNKHKKADNHPDFRVYLSKEREPVAAVAASTPTATVTDSDNESSVDDDLI